MKSDIAICDQDVVVSSRIMLLRGVQVILDRDIAALYGVETKVLNQAVKRNLIRFPERFGFQLTAREMSELVTNCDRFRSMKHSSAGMFAFTEQGVAMLSAVLRSQTAIDVSIRIMDAFVSMRHFIVSNAAVMQRLDAVANFELVKTYWETGCYIVEHEQHGADRAKYGEGLIVNLSKDLRLRYGRGYSRTNLIYMRKLYQTFRKSQTLSDHLSWSHYLEILQCTDKLAIQFYCAECARSRWNVRELRRQMRSSL